MKISSQKHIDQSIVDEKIADADFEVKTATIYDEDGTEWEVIIDGHHSLEAARQTGNAPEFVESGYNFQKEVECLGFNDFLISYIVDSDWYDIETGINVW